MRGSNPVERGVRGLVVAALVAACAKSNSKPATAGRPATRLEAAAEPERTDSDATPDSEPQPESRSESQSEAQRADAAHHVVFADRIRHGYLLLVAASQAPTLTRSDLVALVRSQLAAPEHEPERELLVRLIEREPPRGQLPSGHRRDDLLGLQVEVLPIAGPEGRLIDPAMLEDPVLVRELDRAERKSLAQRRHAILLRADYRNQHGLRGLRLLQTLVELVAKRYDALVYDPDTGETVDLEAFRRRKLRASRSNLADQVAVVPFSDPRHGDGRLRLSTRGMRRFGSVDLELDGLPRDPAALQAATHLLYGLAYTMMHLGEYDDRGYAVALGDVVTLARDDIEAAYGSNSPQLSKCPGCTREIELHLVERPNERHDPEGHVVARVVAPRAQSDREDYDHPNWVAQTLARFVGPLRSLNP